MLGFVNAMRFMPDVILPDAALFGVKLRHMVQVAYCVLHCQLDLGKVALYGCLEFVFQYGRNRIIRNGSDDRSRGDGKKQDNQKDTLAKRKGLHDSVQKVPDSPHCLNP
jgi:hypothetical protein